MTPRFCAAGIALGLTASESFACPSAGGSYRGQSSPDYEMTVEINGAGPHETYGDARADVPMHAKNRGWEAAHTDGTWLRFIAKGCSIRASRGGASRSVHVQRLNQATASRPGGLQDL